MAASFIEFARNAKVLTELVTINGVVCHILKTTAGTPGTDSFVELGRNPRLATDETAGVHTLQVVT